MEQIKVLWFTNTPANGCEFLNMKQNYLGGWLKSLDREIQNKVDLNIAFSSPNIQPFTYQKTSYYPIYIKFSLIYKVLRKVFNYHNNQLYINEYLKIINVVKPHIIHIHGTELLFGEIIGKTSIPIILSIQGNITVYKHKYFSGIEPKYGRNIYSYFNVVKTIFFGNNPFQKIYRSFLNQSQNEQKYFLKCNHIIGRTDWDRRISKILAPNGKYYHCDEILRDAFYENIWKPNALKPVLIHTTTGSSIYKGFETVCSALSLLNQNGGNWKWQVAGITAQDPIVGVVKKKLKRHFPKKNLIFLGNLSEHELVQEMLKADLYVLPSHIENSPNSLCEAMLIGMPCISTYVGGSGSLLTDKSEGLLVQDGDPWAMAGSILDIHADYEKAVLYGRNARKRALTRHNKVNISNSLIEIYETLH